MHSHIAQLAFSQSVPIKYLGIGDKHGRTEAASQAWRGGATPPYLSSLNKTIELQ